MKKLYYFIIVLFVSTSLVCMEKNMKGNKDYMQKNRENRWFLRNSNEKKTGDDLESKVSKLTPCERRLLAIKTVRIPLHPGYPFTNEFDISVMTEAELKSISIFTSKEYNTINQSVCDNIDFENISQKVLKHNIIPELFILWKNPDNKNTPEILARFYAAILTIKKKNIYFILDCSLAKASSKKTQANHGRLLGSIRNSANSFGCKIIYNCTVCEETRLWWEERDYKDGKVKYLN